MTLVGGLREDGRSDEKREKHDEGEQVHGTLHDFLSSSRPEGGGRRRGAPALHAFRIPIRVDSGGTMTDETPWGK
jgi:hypothetical protein